MTWLLAIALAGAAFAAAALLFRLPRQAWSTLAAALMLGLAGYSLQANPGLRGAPAPVRAPDNELGMALIEARQAMVAPDDRSRSPKLLTADAFARNGQYANAAALLRGAVTDNPRDADAWLALGNALVEHADGVLTPPAQFAFRRAEAAHPGAAGPGYFMGLALLRQGRAEEAGALWRLTLERAAPDAAGRAQLAAVLARLDAALAQSRALDAPQAAPQSATVPPGAAGR